MEGIICFAREVVDGLSREPWYLKIGFIFGVLVVSVIAIFVLALCAQVTRTLFALDFAAICYNVYSFFREGLPDVGGIVSVVALCVILVVLFFFLIISDQEGLGMVELFFAGLIDGVVNIGLTMAAFTIIMLPLAISSLRSNDRY